MSLKAKLEAVIYAADEPVTLAQLAQIFASDALEWKAAQSASAAERNAEMAGEPGEASAGPSLLPDQSMVPFDDGSEETAPASQEPAASAEPGDAEAEARRLARQREREIKSVLKQILDELIAGYVSDGRGIEIREIAGGYRMASKPECHDAVRLFVKSLKPPMKLSLPALETLAVVAYKQPVTAPEVSEIRGVEAGGVLGSLLARKLIATAGRKQVIGRPILYKTTREFLLRFGLKDLTELPSMEEFEQMAAAEIEEMEPEAVAADAAEEAAEAAARETAVAGEAAALDENSPGGVEMSAAAEVVEPLETPDSSEAATDATSAATSQLPHMQDAPRSDASAAPPAEPDFSVPAETETVPHAAKGEEER